MKKSSWIRLDDPLEMHHTGTKTTTLKQPLSLGNLLLLLVQKEKPHTEYTSKKKERERSGREENDYIPCGSCGFPTHTHLLSEPKPQLIIRRVQGETTKIPHHHTTTLSI